MYFAISYKAHVCAPHTYYYTPVPLNLANNNKQQATNNKQQQARLHAILGMAPSQRIGSFAHVAFLEPEWCPCQIQVLSQKLTGGGPGRWHQVGRCSPKSAQFWAKNSHFSPIIAPKSRAKRPNEGKLWQRCTCGLTSPCQRPLWCPSTPRYFRETAQRGAKKLQNLRNVHLHPETKPGPYLGLRGLEKGLFGDQKWVTNVSKTHFCRINLGPFGMLKRVFFFCLF